MQAFDSIREVENGKKYDTASNTTLSENNSSEGSPVMNSHKTNQNGSPENRVLTQEEVDERIRLHETARRFDSAGPNNDNCMASKLLPKSR